MLLPELLRLADLSSAQLQEHLQYRVIDPKLPMRSASLEGLRYEQCAPGLPHQIGRYKWEIRLVRGNAQGCMQLPEQDSLPAPRSAGSTDLFNQFCQGIGIQGDLGLLQCQGSVLPWQLPTTPGTDSESLACSGRTSKSLKTRWRISRCMSGKPL